MKARKAFLLLLAALTFAACKYDDSELWEQVNQNTEELAAQAARIAALEAWQAETNTNIQALQTLLSTTDYITAVTPVVKDGVEVGFTISFLNTPAITIYHGTKGDKGDKGDTPQIGAAQGDDGNWYWTLNGELLTDTDGNPIRANGTQGEQGEPGSDGDDAPLPQLATGAKLTDQGITTDSQNNAIVADAIYLSVDGGKTWTRVSGEDGKKGDPGTTGPKGDSFFKGIDTTNPDYVTFTLANNGGTFQVPRYTGISLTFDVPGVSLPYGQTAKIQCIVTGIDNPTADDLYLITVPDGWKASISVNLILTVTAPADITSGVATGEILVMLDNKKGSTTIGRITVFCGTELTIGNLQPGQLATLIGSRIDLKSITVTSGEINDDDWEAIKRNKDMLTDLDLAGTTYTGDDAAKFAYTGHMGDNSTLQTIKLPQGITDIRDYAFNHCSSLTSIDFPVALNTIGSYAFFGCSPLKSIEIPSGVTGIGAGAFGDCSSLSTATFLGETPPIHIGHVFYQCTALSDIYVPAGSVDAYKETWFEYADKIKAIEP
jgi:hypothetical protein